MPSLKEDESFIEFLSLGATATERAIAYLNNKGHNIIELERGALSSRIWKNKEKQLRVPDLLCINCGRKIESRGKRNLEITMSHSTSDDDRAWDHDAEDEDWVALVKCEKTGDHPRDWEPPDKVNIVSYEKLRETEGKTKQARSGPTQGSELTITWPSTTSTADGVVKQIKNGERIQILRGSDDYTLSYSLEKKISDDEHAKLKPLVDPGEHVSGETEFIAAPFEPLDGDEISCPNDYAEDQWVDRLSSDSFSNRFSAIKALGYVHSEQGIEKLKAEITDDSSNPFVRLEAAASLAKQDEEDGWDYLSDILEKSNEENLSERLETIIILREIKDEKSVSFLQDVLTDTQENDELRAEAAHGLGLLSAKGALQDLIDGLRASSELIKRDCITAIANAIEGDEPILLEALQSDEYDIQYGCALALATAGPGCIENLIADSEDVPADGLAIALSLIDKSRAESIVTEAELDEKIIFAVETMSDFFNSWPDELSSDLRYQLKKANDSKNKKETVQSTFA
jgi:hypothetical protein